MAPSKRSATRAWQALFHCREAAGFPHISPSPSTLLGHLGITIHANGAVLVLENVIGDQPQDFRVNRLRCHQALQGIARFRLYAVWRPVSWTADPRVFAWTDRLPGSTCIETKSRPRKRPLARGDVCWNDRRGRPPGIRSDAIFQYKFPNSRRQGACGPGGLAQIKGRGSRPGCLPLASGMNFEQH